MNSELWKKYSEQYGVRFSNRQKSKARVALIEDFKALDYPCEVIKGSSFLTKVTNLLFGSLKNAKTVIVVPFDTPSRAFWPKVSYYPQDGTATANKGLVPTFLPIIVLYLLLMLLMYGMEGRIADPMLMSFVLTIIFIGIFTLFYLMVHGVGNRKNYNRNSASIYAAYEIAKALDKEQRRKVAFLFVDKNKTRHLGAKVAVEDFMKANKNPNIIVLNCIGMGNERVIGFNPQNKKVAQEINKPLANRDRMKMMEVEGSMRTGSVMEHFQKAIILSCGDYDAKGRLCVMNTSTGKDKEVSEENIEFMISTLRSYLKN